MSLGIDLGRSGAKISAALRQAQHANQSLDRMGACRSLGGWLARA